MLLLPRWVERKGGGARTAGQQPDGPRGALARLVLRLPAAGLLPDDPKKIEKILSAAPSL